MYFMKKLKAPLAGAAVGSLTTGVAHAQWRGPMGPGMMGDYGWGMGWFGGIFMLLFWGAIIVGLFLAIRWLWVSSAHGTRKSELKDSALEILRQRYARGEIGKEEFEEKKKDLQ